MRSRLLCAAVALLPLAALAGCGATASNGVASKAPNEILAAAQSAASGAKAVHLAGSVAARGTPLSVDLDLVAGKGAEGQIAEHGLPFQLVALEDALYIYGSTAFYRHFGGNAAVQLFQGRWLKAPASGEFASLATLTHMRTLFGALLGGRGKLEPAGAAVIGGQKAVGVTDASDRATLYVATTGKPYPVALIQGGAGGGRLLFARWDEPVSIAAPPNAINIAALERT
jgi:hypothetical protein